MPNADFSLAERCSIGKLFSAESQAMKKGDKGFALVIVIWVLSLLSLMAGSFALTMRRESSVTAALKNNAQASALAEGALEQALFMLQHADPQRRWRADGRLYRFMGDEGAEIRVKIVAESGKIDINTANDNQLAALIKALTDDSWQQQHLLNCLLDWRDADDEPRPHGAEKKQYRDAGLPYLPSNRPFQSLEELQRVIGFDADLFSRLQAWITVYSGLKEVDLQTAPPEVLRILSNDLKERNIDNPYLKRRLAGDQQDELDAPRQAGAAKGQNQTYTISVLVKLEDEASAALEAVIKLEPQALGKQARQVLDWRPNRSSLFADAMESRLTTVEDEFTNDY